MKEPIEKKLVKPVALDLKQTRTSFFYSFNMDSLGIMPGQNMEVYFEVWDNDGFHGPKSKRSEMFTYYKPSEAALDSIADQQSEDIMERLQEKSQEADKLQEEIEKMLQDLIQKKDLDWSDKEKMKDLLEKQQQIQEEWNKLQEEQEKLSDFMKELKEKSSKWLKTQPNFPDFVGWAEGYAALSKKSSDVETVTNYIKGQKEHHEKCEFPAEYRKLLEDHGVEIDERYFLKDE